MVEDLLTLLMLVMLQVVLGLDNLLYISLESQRAPKEDQERVRKMGIGIAIFFRIILLFVIYSLVKALQEPFTKIHWEGIFEAKPSIHSIIVLLGGGFIVYTATKEIIHMLTLDPTEAKNQKPTSANSAIFMIVVMSLVFSFDSILSAIALTKVFWVMAVAIVIGGVMMIFLAKRVSDFLQKNKAYEVLGLFVLFVVGIMLVTEGGHLAHLHLFGQPVEAMSKTTFYFVIVVLILTDIVQTIYKKNLNKAK
ncbi:MAG: tellurium resistance protein TerC [Bacteroidota bacterium]